MPQDDTIELVVQVELKDADAEDLDCQTRQLRAEIQEFDVESVELIAESHIPEGAKGLDPVILGALAVTISPTVLTKFLEFLQAWAMRREGRVVKVKVQNEDGASVEIEVPALMSTDEVKRWISTITESLPQRKARNKGK